MNKLTTSDYNDIYNVITNIKIQVSNVIEKDLPLHIIDNNLHIILSEFALRMLNKNVNDN